MKTIYCKSICLVFLFLLVLFIETGFSQSSENYSLQKSVFDNSGQISVSPNYNLIDVTGQSSDPGILFSTQNSLIAGFLETSINFNTLIDDNFPQLENITSFQLFPAFPNPFNPGTTLRYALPKFVKVNISIYNVLGQHVRTLIDRDHKPGVYTTYWDGNDDTGNAIGSGIYFYQIQAGEFIKSNKLILIK